MRGVVLRGSMGPLVCCCRRDTDAEHLIEIRRVYTPDWLLAALGSSQVACVAKYCGGAADLVAQRQGIPQG
jgi:hypothetical protein